MNETQRTLTFVIVAAVSVISARFAGPSVPKPAAEVSDIGNAFYPDFKDADAAKSLQVVTYNPDKAEARPFSVQQGKDGLWRIPSRHNYPADGKDRLAKTATSMIGIKREAFAGRREAEHAEFGVLDPLGDGASDLKGIGNSITLRDANDKVLASYIIGKEIKGRPGFHYIRKPDEKATYIAKLDIQVSTKFTDWIEADLLKIDNFRLNEIAIDTTSVDPNQRAIVEGEMNKLMRKTSSDPWKMDGIDEATEEPNQDEIRKIVSALDELKIVGVRPKPPRLMQSLREGEGLQLDQPTVIDLDMKGFFLVKSQKGGGYRLIPKEGKVIAVTDQGVAYDLSFGEVFSGSEEEVEVGFVAKNGDKDKKPEGEGKEEDKKPESEKSLLKSRYLFVMVHFDAAGLGPKPESPVKPQPPSETPAANATVEDAPVDATAPVNTAEDPKKVYEAALAKYEADQKKYEADKKTYEQKLKDGQKLVKDLNARFADWYYVVSGESFENLRQGKKTLVKSKLANLNPDKPADPADAAPPLTPPSPK